MWIVHDPPILHPYSAEDTLIFSRETTAPNMHVVLDTLSIKMLHPLMPQGGAGVSLELDQPDALLGSLTPAVGPEGWSFSLARTSYAS